MSWSKIKDIMISVLVVINLFLIADIALSRYMSQAIPDGAEESFVNILEKGYIKVEKNVVSGSYEKRSIITAEPYEIDYLSEKFIGKKGSYVSEGTDIIAPGDDKKLIISDEGIEFATLKKAAPKNGKAILKALSKSGIGKSGMYYDETDGYVKVKIDNCPVEGVYLDVFLDSEGEIASFKGVWPKIKVTGQDEKVSVISAVNDIKETLPKGSVITDIEKIYYFEKDENGYKIVPAWRVYNQARAYTVR